MKRPFRLELNGLVSTYSSERAARYAVVKLCNIGDRWKIVERRRVPVPNSLTRMRTEFLTIAEGVA